MARIIGVGTDIVDIGRIRSAIERHGERFLSKAFTTAEQEYCLSRADPAVHFSGRFAAKEAVLKALGCGFGRGVSLTDVEIASGDRAPAVTLLGAAAEVAADRKADLPVLVSISHARESAVAFAIAQGEIDAGAAPG